MTEFSIHLSLNRFVRNNKSTREVMKAKDILKVFMHSYIPALLIAVDDDDNGSAIVSQTVIH